MMFVFLFVLGYFCVFLRSFKHVIFFVRLLFEPAVVTTLARKGTKTAISKRRPFQYNGFCLARGFVSAGTSSFAVGYESQVREGLRSQNDMEGSFMCWLRLLVKFLIWHFRKNMRVAMVLPSESNLSRKAVQTNNIEEF